MAVTLRTRPSKKGTVYYLDIIAEGTRSTETLKIDFSLPEKERKAMAEISAAEIQKNLMVHSLGLTRQKTRNFIAYFETYCQSVPSYNRKYSQCLKHLKVCFGNTLLTTQMDQLSMEKFKRHLRANLNGETPRTMWACLRRVINVAKRQGLLRIDPAEGIKRPDIPDTVSKAVLSAKELVTLIHTPMPDNYTCRAWLWCFYTGMARKDITLLKWSGIDIDRKQLTYKRAKGKTVVVDLTDFAITCLPEKGSSPFVFGLLPSDSYCHRTINQWVSEAGINKRVSFYVSRHTFAVLLLEAGTDLLTVSRLMGHSSTTHTVKYLKLTDHLKRSAVDRLPKP